MILCDIHTHSDNSFDAKSSVDAMCAAAIKAGLSVLAVTDHCEAEYIRCGEDCEFGSFDRQIPKSISDIRAAQKKYKGKLKLLCGLELGEPMHYPKLTKSALEIADFDFILASVHNLKDEEDFYYLDYSEVNIPLMFRKYFDELLDTAENAEFDSLAHLTYPLRYIVERTDIRPDLSVYSETIDDIFKALIKREKALEINTSGLSKPIGTTLPDINYVKRFRELGGKYITIGSDAHRTEDLAKGIEKGMEIARICGFEHYTVFENRKPRMVEIWY